MPDNLFVQPDLVTTEAPRPGVSPGQVAQPYEELSRALGKAGNAAEGIAENAATRAGFQAVTTDENGNVQVQKAPIIGEASQAYERAAKLGAMAQGEGIAKDKDIELRNQFQNDPQGYLREANKYKDGVMKQYADLGLPEVGVSLGRAIDSTTTFTFRSLENQKRETDLRSAAKNIDDGIADAENELVAHARQGNLPDDKNPGSPASLALEKVRTLLNERITNPMLARLGYTPEQRDHEISQLDSELRANSTLFHVDSVYHDQGVNPDGTAKGGYQNALTEAQKILTEPSLNLKPEERQHYYNLAVSELHANEFMRHQDIAEARASEQSFNEAVMFGGLKGMSSAEIRKAGNNVADAFTQAGDPASAARVYAKLSRLQLGDDWVTTRTLDQQTQDVNELRGAPRQRAAYDFFRAKGYTPEQAAGIVGGLRGETENLNPSQIHDGGIGLGIAGWNAERLAGLRRFAADNKADPRDLNTQLEYVNYELTHGESAAGDQLRAAKTPEDAGRAMLNYFRPANYDVPGAHPERAAYARVAFNAFGGGAGSGPAAGASPAADLWLAANRSNELSREVQTEWKQITADYGKTGQRPANAVIGKIVDAAYAAEDHGLLEQIAADTERMDASEALLGKSIPQQSAIIGTLEQKAQAGELEPGTPIGLVGHRGVAITAGDGAVLKDLEQRHAMLIKNLDENPISTGAAFSGGRFSVPTPLDFSDPQKLAGGLQQRVPIARFANQTWQGKPVAALDDADVKAVQAQLANPDPNARAQIWGALATLPDDVRGPTFEKIAGKDTNKLAEASAGAMMRDDPDMAKSVIQGLDIMSKNDSGILKAFEPENKAPGGGFNVDFTSTLPPTAFGEQNRFDPTGNYATLAQMVKGRYAYLATQAGDTNYSKDRLDSAVNDVTGGIVQTAGGKTIAPARGMGQRDYDRVMSGITDNDLAGVTDLNGRPVTADFLRQQGGLEAIGPGRYLVNFSRSEKPIYAFRYANTEQPERFVLDLRGRPPAPLNRTDAPEQMFADELR